jgi:WD40 repeat protein
LAFSPNDHWIATGSLDETARVFEASTGKEISRLAHEGAVVSVAFSPDGRWVATASLDKTTRVFEAATGNQVSRIVHQSGVSTVAFSPDGRWIATSSALTARVLEAATGKEISRRRFQTPVVRVKFSPDGRRIAAADSRMIVVLEAATGNEISQNSLNYHEYQEDAIAFSPDGRWIADAGSMARVIDANTGKEISHLRHDDFVTAVVFSPNGRWVATASADHTSRIFEAATGREISVLPHPGPVMKVAFSPDGRLLATGSGQPNHTTARVFEVVAKEKEIAPLDEDRAVVGTAFIVNARLLATISRDGFTRIFDISTGKEFMRFGQRERQAWPISPDGRLFAARDKRRTGIYEVATDKEVSVLANEGTAFAFSPDGRRVATIGEKGNAQIFESETGRKISDALYPYNPNVNRSLLVLAFSPNGRWVANGPFVVEAATGRVISEHSEGRSYNPATRLSFSPDNRLVARGNYSNNTVSVLEAATGKEILSVAHRGTVQAVAFSPNGRWIATAGADKTARVFEVATGEERFRFTYQGRVVDVAFSRDSRHLYSLSDTIAPSLYLIGFARAAGQDEVGARGLWLDQNLLNAEDLIQEVCSRLTSNLTPGQWKQYLGHELYRKTCPSLPAPPNPQPGK